LAGAPAAEVERWMLIAPGTPSSVIVLVVDDSADDELTSLLATTTPDAQRELDLAFRELARPLQAAMDRMSPVATVGRR
jgi:hypothetical protein